MRETKPKRENPFLFHVVLFLCLDFFCVESLIEGTLVMCKRNLYIVVVKLCKETQKDEVPHILLYPKAALLLPQAL